MPVTAQVEDEMLPSEEDEIGEDDGSEEEDEDEDGEGDSDEDEDEESEDDEEQRPRKKRRSHVPFVPPAPRAMPARTTRGNRMGKVVADEGDEEFWNQEALKEEEDDVEYATESEPEDVVDADFDESEEEEASEDEEAEAAAKDAKKKTLKPPGYKKPPLPPKPKPPAAPKPKKRASVDTGDATARRVSVRESTRQKVEEAEQERKLLEMMKPRRAPRQHRPKATLTQAELLAEAANTEIENTRSLQMLQLIEEETRKKATSDKKRYVGPMVRFQSRVRDGQELTTLEVRNMHTPPELQPRVAPPPPARQLCVITGHPARYRDPHTRLPYASLEAFQELTRRKQVGLLAAPQAPAPGQQHHPAAAPTLYDHATQHAAQQQQQHHSLLQQQQQLYAAG